MSEKNLKVRLVLAFVLAVFLYLKRLDFTLLPAAEILFGILLSLVFPYLDYIVYAYILRPKDEFSVNVKGLIQRRYFRGAISYIEDHKNMDIKPMVNSALFQGLLIFVGLYVSTTNQSLMGSAFLVGVMLQLCVRFYYDLHMYSRWFWFVKGDVTFSVARVWLAINVFFILVYSLAI